MIVQPALAQNMRANCISRLSALNAPFDSSYSVEFFNAIATGVANTINGAQFATSDTGFGGTPPIPGAGTGVGLFVNKPLFVQKLYTEMRASSASCASTLNATTGHPAWPPPEDNALLLMCRGIVDAIDTALRSQAILTSTHPLVYSGTGVITNLSGFSPSSISNFIKTAANSLQGVCWPFLCAGIGQSCFEIFSNSTTGTLTITGICVPNVSQACNIPRTGSGSGVVS